MGHRIGSHGGIGFHSGILRILLFSLPPARPDELSPEFRRGNNLTLPEAEDRCRLSEPFRPAAGPWLGPNSGLRISIGKFRFGWTFRCRRPGWGAASH